MKLAISIAYPFPLLVAPPLTIGTAELPLRFCLCLYKTIAAALLVIPYFKAKLLKVGLFSYSAINW